MKKLIIALLLAFSLIGNAQAIEPLNLPTPYDMVMLAGADYSLPVILKLSSTTTEDITGYAYAAQFRSGPAPSGIVFANFSTIITTPVNGMLRVSLSRRQTLPLSGKSGVWDLRQTTTAGVVTYVISGKASVRPTVTQ
jgi:hypothetical protein